MKKNLKYLIGMTMLLLSVIIISPQKVFAAETATTYTAKKGSMRITIDIYQTVGNKVYMMIEHRYDDINQESSYYDYVVGKKSGKTIKLTATGSDGKEKGKLVKQGSGYRYTLLSKKSGSKGTVTVKKRGKITKKYLKYFYGTWKTEFGDSIKITKNKLDGKNYRVLECKKKNGKYYLYTIVKNKSGGKYYFEKGMYELSSGKKNSMIGYWYNPAWGGYTGGYSLRK